jgi:hypothetical protein
VATLREVRLAVAATHAPRLGFELRFFLGGIERSIARNEAAPEPGCRLGVGVALRGGDDLRGRHLEAVLTRQRPPPLGIAHADEEGVETHRQTRRVDHRRGNAFSYVVEVPVSRRQRGACAAPWVGIDEILGRVDRHRARDPEQRRSRRAPTVL